MEEGKWRWIHSGEVVKINDWYPGEPNGARNANILGGYEKGQYKWIDEPRTNKQGFVCEKEGNRSMLFCVGGGGVHVRAEEGMGEG
ncbi:hypothetical protein FSP39_013256 [Pinctada imbricata]|uniref:C-type lectin domain-containing protein n=1 Tax=Pinctada imbricata TaxID=66713 RepID=A0AA89BT08_PINIB|nr:hypothetical protein FSP39_013256 [Pinctada imbricata]